MSCVAFVFARGGSKGVPRKNIRPLGGLPLLAWSIRTAQETPEIDRVVVSTEDPEIASVARGYDAEVLDRPAALASDDAPEWLAWRHAVGMFRERSEPLDVFVSLPATAPLRAPGDVSACIARLREPATDIVFTVTEAARSPWFNMVRLDSTGHVGLVIPPASSVERRQDAPVVYDMTTVAYVTTPDYVMRAHGVFEGSARAVIVPRERAIDIDTELDFVIAECLARGALQP